MAKFNFGNGAKRSYRKRSDAADGDGSGVAGANAGNPIDPDGAIGEGFNAGNDGNGGSDSGNDGSAGSVQPKRRGRPPGSRNKSSGSGGTGKTKVSSSVTGIEKTLVSLHLIAATLSGVPEIALEDAEASAIAEGIANVNEHYSIPGIDEGPASIVMLVGTLLAVYGKRWLILRNKKAKPAKRSAETAPDESNVSQFPLASSPGGMFGLGAA